MVGCLLCKADVKIDEESFTLKHCNHIICYKCLCDYLSINIKCRIKCPIEKCDKYIPDQIIRKCLSNELIHLYEQLSILASTPKAVRCLTKDCPFIIVVENEKTIFQCSYCNQPNCVKCKKRHYPNQCNNINENELKFDIAAADSMKIHQKAEIEKLFKDENSIPNYESFDCGLCCRFILPRQGVIFRNCHHCLCKNCFTSLIDNIKQIDEFRCPLCEMPLNDLEVLDVIKMTNFSKLNVKKIALKLFTCKYPDCNGLWDSNNCKGLYTCHVCKHVNCLDCKDCHEGISCDKFRLSKRFKDVRKAEQEIENYQKVQCTCGRLLIQNGGCGAIYCDNCGIHVCLFTGKMAGDYGPNSCGCNSEKTCHENCKFGCYVERKKKILKTKIDT